MVCHSLLQWTAFCQSSPPRLIHLGWPYMEWLIVSLSPQWREKREEDEFRTGAGQRQLSGGTCQPLSWGGREHPTCPREERWCQGWRRTKTSSGGTCQSLSGGAPQLSPACVANQMPAPETKVKPHINQMKPSPAEAHVLHHHLCPACYRGFSWPKDWTQLFHIVGRHFINLATREALGVGSSEEAVVNMFKDVVKVTSN